MSMLEDSENRADKAIKAYSDELHAEDISELIIGEHNYKFRLLEGRMMPPYVTPSRYKTSRELDTRPGDICFTSYPKSGSTWLAHIVLLITCNGETPADGTLRSNIHWAESSWTYPRSKAELEALAAPRIFKSHMPYAMALGGVPANSPCRYVYIARNPKDVIVSYYHFESGTAWSGAYDGPWEHWFESFLKGKIQRGDWFDHVLGWWHASREASNILFLRYEDLLTDFPQELSRLCDFLGYPLTDEVMLEIQRKTEYGAMSADRFSNMSEITDLETFFRKGKIGSWKEQFTAEQDQRFSDVIEERLQDTGLTFVYE